MAFDLLERAAAAGPRHRLLADVIGTNSTAGADLRRRQGRRPKSFAPSRSTTTSSPRAILQTDGTLLARFDASGGRGAVPAHAVDACASGAQRWHAFDGRHRCCWRARSCSIATSSARSRSSRTCRASGRRPTAFGCVLALVLLGAVALSLRRSRRGSSASISSPLLRLTDSHARRHARPALRRARRAAAATTRSAS